MSICDVTMIEQSPVSHRSAPILERVSNIDWLKVNEELHETGWTILPGLLSVAECQDIASVYDESDRFRSHISMSRYGFGQGEYKYFNYPLPSIVDELRSVLYSQLVTIANQWSRLFGSEIRYPHNHMDFVKRCRQAGQTRPTPLLLRYTQGDYNKLHQDVYGTLVFPLQTAILLSQPGKDFNGGEFIITEQRPYSQTIANVVPLQQGDAVIFAVNKRPVKGKRGTYKATMRHGVSKIVSGHRYTLGVILHDAA